MGRETSCLVVESRRLKSFGLSRARSASWVYPKKVLRRPKRLRAIKMPPAMTSRRASFIVLLVWWGFVVVIWLLLSVGSKGLHARKDEEDARGDAEQVGT
jgi:hypothetical protein